MTVKTLNDQIKDLKNRLLTKNDECNALNGRVRYLENENTHLLDQNSLLQQPRSPYQQQFIHAQGSLNIQSTSNNQNYRSNFNVLVEEPEEKDDSHLYGQQIRDNNNQMQQTLKSEIETTEKIYNNNRFINHKTGQLQANHQNRISNQSKRIKRPNENKNFKTNKPQQYLSTTPEGVFKEFNNDLFIR